MTLLQIYSRDLCCSLDVVMTQDISGSPVSCHCYKFIPVVSIVKINFKSVICALLY
jgi:hypothetical protein